MTILNTRRFAPYAALVTGCAAFLAVATAAASPSIFPTGVTRYDPTRAYNSYIVDGSNDGKTPLIDMDGHNVHEWNAWGFPSEVLPRELAGGELGHVLVQLSAEPGDGPVIFRNKTIGELDWNGKTVWEWGERAPGGRAYQNHDWARLATGTTLTVVRVVRPRPRFFL